MKNKIEWKNILVDELRIKTAQLELKKILIEKVLKNKFKKRKQGNERTVDSILYSRSYKIVNKISNIIKRS